MLNRITETAEQLMCVINILLLNIALLLLDKKQLNHTILMPCRKRSWVIFQAVLEMNAVLSQFQGGCKVLM